VLELRRQQVAALSVRLERSQAGQIKARKAELDGLHQKLILLSPEGTLERGYSIAMTPEGAVIRSVTEVRPGLHLSTRFRDGRVESVAT